VESKNVMGVEIFSPLPITVLSSLPFPTLSSVTLLGQNPFQIRS